MKRINVLDINTANKIAAGEVVERPSSVVKELIENSIDAESKNITVELIDGGLKTIKINDDGYGIHPEDIKVAFLPHATSKISIIDDIFNINSLGFRGEALASIASVSNTILKSRTKEFNYGKEINITGGNINYIKDVGCNIGTYVEVNDIFFNVPARFKFLKSVQRETALISDIIQRLALANTKISFKLINNDKKVISTYSTEQLSDTIRNIYGKSTSENIINFEKHCDIASVHGYIGNAEISRGSRNNQSVFVNKRYIKSKLIATAVESAFKSFLTINKYPFFVLFLDIYPELIDVNVHPTKSEIKFKDDRTIFKLVFDAIHEAIRKSFKATFDFEGIESKSLANEFLTETKTYQIPIDLKTNNHIQYVNESINKFNFNEDASSQKDDSRRLDIYYNEVLPQGFISKGTKDIEIVNDDKECKIPITKISKFNELNVIGQFNNTYILAQENEDLYIIDQHAAHEKILFEKFMRDLKNKDIRVQVLMTPTVLELTSEEYLYYSENIDLFINLGFNIEVFGENTISIREVPIILGDIDIKNFFVSIIDNLKNMGTGQPAEVKYDKVAKLACKAAIKANNNLSYIEMKALIEELRFIDNPFTCPHGRPTIIKITLQEMEKRFKRIQ